ncbi:hypothetical protein AVEN_48937-1 [Araneus ventricosus]|uniref:Uncharacterized protein n=1 Tax=Araneus ventricosus TaxID=182803 RepID=A0A4Y2AJ56_ARAVE|nr:hypothetical protein AVEN_48937-1 [Araneus ventricosus]
MYLKDGRCNSWSAETGVPVAITGHDPTPPEGRTLYHRQRASPSHYYTHQGSETPLTYPAVSHLRTRGDPQCNNILCNSELIGKTLKGGRLYFLYGNEWVQVTR